MKLSDYKNEDALDLLMDILEPTARILSDKELAEAVRNRTNKVTAIKIAVKNSKSSVMEILARLNNTPVEKYECNAIQILHQLLELINDEGMMDFFTSQAQTKVENLSTPVTETTEEEKK